MQNIVFVGIGIRFKGLLACMGFNKSGFFAQRPLFVIATPIIDDKAVFLLQLPAYPVSFPEIAERFMPGMLLRVDHVVGNVHMEIGRVLVDAVMPLMLGVPQSGGKALFYGSERLRRFASSSGRKLMIRW